MHSGWRRGEFRDCISEITSGRSVNSSDTQAETDEIGVLKTSCVYNGYFDPKENKRVLESEVQLVKCSAKKDNIIVSRMNTASLVGASGLIESDYPNLYLPDRLWLVAPKGQIDVRWFALVVGSPQVRRRLSDAASGTSASMKNISQDVFLNMPVSIPPLDEQRKIAAILRTWDEGIEKLNSLRAEKQKLYALLSYRLIFGGQRRSEQQEVRRFFRLGEVTRELNERNAGERLGRESVMGVTNSRGIVPMREQTIGSDLSRYQILPPGAFAYNPMRINVGSIAMSRFTSDVLVSPDYVLFECLPGKLDPDYLDHFRQSHFWAHYINAGGSGSVRMRTYYDDLAALKIRLPAFEEQKAISAALNAAQEEIRLIEKEREVLATQKRGLMQKLLTGEWRVKVEAD